MGFLVCADSPTNILKPFGSWQTLSRWFGNVHFYCDTVFHFIYAANPSFKAMGLVFFR